MPRASIAYAIITTSSPGFAECMLNVNMLSTYRNSFFAAVASAALDKVS